MKSKFSYVFMIIFVFGFWEICAAQEVQVSLDQEGKIEVIDSKLEKKLGLFKDYNNFKEARLFKTSDSTYVLEISYKEQQKVLRTRLPLTADETKDLQKEVTDRIQEKSPETGLDQEGRTKLIRGCLGLSMGFYGWALPAALNTNDGKLAAGLYMLTSGAGYFIPFTATRNMQVSDAAATLFLYGGTRGIWHGIALAGMLSDDPGRGLLFAGIGVSLAEAFIGFNMADKYNMSAGTAEVIGVGGDFGLGLGLGTAVLMESDRVAAAGTILLGSGLGLISGKWLAGQQPYTRGDAQVLNGTGLLGAYIPLALVDMTGTDNEKAYVAASMLGSVTGLWLGQKLVKGKDFTTAQGYLIELSELAGGLLGLGFAYILSPKDNVNSTLFLTSSAVGAAGGFWIMYGYYAPKAESDSQASSWNVNIRPEGLLSLTMGKKINRELQRHMHLVSFSYRF